jgi:hypothetical protein
MSAGQWLERHISAAPVALQGRIRQVTDAIPPGEDTATALARIATDTLESVIGGTGDRSAALDLLTADALITLALLAQAEADPSHLGEWSLRLLGAGAAAA